jgi:glycosyltransferase involved in cell wall biosynthesis
LKEKDLGVLSLSNSTIDIAYEGPFFDYSGYGEANRQAIYALDSSGVNVNAKLLRYTPQGSDYGLQSHVLDKCLSKNHEYDLKIMHVTPDEIGRLIELEKYSISHFFWETDRVPTAFVNGLNLVNEIWTGSKANLEAIRRSGIETPVYIYPQAINTESIAGKSFSLDFDGYLFYSIFEWTDRKNPNALLKAYADAFPEEENVGLIIKSYISTFDEKSKNTIIDRIRQAVSDYKIKNKIFFHHELMTYAQVHGLHQRADCYVSAHRGEGWGVPQAEALTHCNPVISTGYGGINEYFDSMQNGIVIPYEMVALSGMSHAQHYYSKDQMWAEVDLQALSQAMRFVFDNQETAKEIGRNGQLLAKQKFSYKEVGGLMRHRIEEILGDTL